MKCKPGDLAIIINCDVPETIGAIVTVVSRAEMMHTKKYGPMDAWVVRSKHPLKMVNSSPATKFYHPDAFLHPIRDGEITKKEERENELVS